MGNFSNIRNINIQNKNTNETPFTPNNILFSIVGCL